MSVPACSDLRKPSTTSTNEVYNRAITSTPAFYKILRLNALCFKYNLPFGILVLNNVRTDRFMHDSVAKQLNRDGYL